MAKGPLDPVVKPVAGNGPLDSVSKRQLIKRYRTKL
jgi:hypothetical protein